MKFERYKDIPQLQGKSRSETTELIREARKQDRFIFWIDIICTIVYGAIYVLVLECILHKTWKPEVIGYVLLFASAFIIPYLFSKLCYGFIVVPRVRKAIEAIEKSRA